jgi:ubiquinone/menaquinone biosynthesis C-methylase UbiE
MVFCLERGCVMRGAGMEMDGFSLLRSWEPAMQIEATAEIQGIQSEPQKLMPDYLIRNYWWAYIHPKGVRVFERQWLVNLILWGNFARLRDAALDELGATINGRTLQVACVYGDFSIRLAERVAQGGLLDVVDVLPIQLQNLRRKLPASAPVMLYQHDSTRLGFANAQYDRAVIFFLLHEQPDSARRQTLAETLRVIKPGGKLVIVDYCGPRRMHPMRYFFRPILRAFEPYALDLWHREVTEWLPNDAPLKQVRKEVFWGGLYQKVVITL